MKWLPYIIFFGIVFIFWILGYTTIVDIMKLSVAGVVAGVTNQAIQKYKEIKEKCLLHSKLLLDNNLRVRANTSVFFAHDIHSDILELTVMIKPEMLDSNPIEYNPLDYRYSKEIDGHLASGYSEKVWKHATERDSLIIKHNAMAKDFLNKEKERIISEIKKENPSLIEWQEEFGQQPTKYFHPRNIRDYLGHIVQISYDSLLDFDKYCIVKPANDQWILVANDFALAKGDTEKEIQEIKKRIITISNDSLKGEEFKILKKYFEDIKEKHEIYINGIDEIIKEVENGISMKGHCRFCPKDSLLNYMF